MRGGVSDSASSNDVIISTRTSANGVFFLFNNCLKNRNYLLYKYKHSTFCQKIMNLMNQFNNLE